MENNNVITVQPIRTDESKLYETEAEMFYKDAQSIMINTQADYNNYVHILQMVKGKLKQIDDKRKEITKPLDQAKKSIMDLFRKPLDKLQEVEKIIKNALIIYQDIQENIRKEEENRLRIEAEKERAKLERKAQRIEEKGDVEKAEEIRQEAEIIQAPIVAPKIDKVAGISFREKWYAKITNFKILPDEYKLPDMQLLNKIAQSSQGKLQIAGVEFRSEKIATSISK